jgi:NAD(P)-dependent dehydrogenase (short-subunit alcohol dehydrogenase family)
MERLVTQEDVGRLAGRHVLIVGAATGAGRATAFRFATEGASVAIADINAEGAEAVAAGIRHKGGNAVAIVGDVADEDDARRFVTTTTDAFGSIDVLHNNAAALHLIRHDQDLVSLEASVIDEMFAVNVKGPMLVCKHAIPGMLAAGRGVIINTASMTAVQADPGLVAYGASKAALMSVTRSIATLYGRRGIRCNTIVPNFMLTERAKANYDAEGLRLKLSERLVDRLAEPEDLANVALFLASDESAYIQGQAILMDGGDRAHRPSVTVTSWEELS